MECASTSRATGRFSPLAGIRWLQHQKAMEIAFSETIFEFQSPRGDSMVATIVNTLITTGLPYWFQSPRGDSMVATSP